MELRKWVDDFWDRIRQEEVIILFGAGSKAHQIMSLLESKQIYPVAVCDNNSKLWGTKFEYGDSQIPIMSYDAMKDKYRNYGIILSVAVQNAISIKQQLRDLDEKNAIYHITNPFKVENQFLECEDEKREEKLLEYREVFADDFSKDLYIDFLKYKMTGDVLGIAQKVDGDSFFDGKLIDKEIAHTYIDVGAYTGDTICKFLQFCEGNYEKIIGFEADCGNAVAAETFLKYGRIENARIVNKGCWSEKTVLKFHTLSQDNAIHYDSPNFYRSVGHSMDNRSVEEGKQLKLQEEEYAMEVDALDNMLQGERPTLIKINALAADIPILKGCCNLIEENHPTIIMEYGTRPDYIVEALKVMKELSVQYKCYLRVKKIFGDIKVILYVRWEG